MHSYLKLDFLTEEDIVEIYDLYDKWQHYKEIKDYKQSDIYRNFYKEWDASLSDPHDWTPIFESLKHRKKRFLRNKEILNNRVACKMLSLLTKEQKEIADYYKVPHC